MCPPSLKIINNKDKDTTKSRNKLQIAHKQYTRLMSSLANVTRTVTQAFQGPSSVLKAFYVINTDKLPGHG
jgi:hypothetical protein